MGMVQALRCKFGHHEWEPILGDIEHSHHKCEHCGKVMPVKVTAPRDAKGGSKPGAPPIIW